ncbi:MAG: MBOAT family protein [Deltaproteobacteria bacterium]|nr:MBOAT family protein [Deltaproteobacteria bacterium]
MSFDSLEFLLFAGAFFALWPLFRTTDRRRWAFLGLASLFFYAWGGLKFTPLLLSTAIVSWATGLAIDRWRERRRPILLASLAVNLGTLGFFKYLDFLLENVNEVFAAFGVRSQLPFARLVLPVGISFYTFEAISYTVDVYRGRVKPARSFLEFFAFLALFPRLVAGPIVRAGQFMPQLESWTRPTPLRLWDGLRLIVYGFTKKLVVADHLARAVDSGFRASEVAGTTPFWWLMSLLFVVQIYCDFSGYSDIARGLAKWMGYDLPVNFDHPLFSPSMTKFWQRWHVSLMSWLRDYVFYPLSGKRPSSLRINLAMTVTMLASGVWHGAAWTFILWGGINAIYLWAERALKWPERLAKLRGGKGLSIAITFVLFVFAAVFFRAQTIGQALAIAGRMWSFDLGQPISLVKDYFFELLLAGAVLARSLWFHVRLPQLGGWRRRARYYSEPLELAVLLTACVFLRGPGNAFIYFQF